ncbi:MAG: endonuclease/exonuclease/phosphatase family protein [Clostridiales bacterium]|nr:endonuclease/exonuclease/phosphatase family protein [Clostridiales bacterium]
MGCGEELRVISFNLKHDLPLFKKHRWEQRKALAAEVIRRSGAAIIGVQELTPFMRQDLEELLREDYAIAGFGRYYGTRRKNEDEHSDILVRRGSARLCYCKTFWLSSSPERYGSRGLLAAFPRICTVAEAQLLESGRRVRIFNTHFDHISGPARNLAARVILQYMQELDLREPLPKILMGDLNASYESRAVRILRENRHEYPFRLQDVYSRFVTGTPVGTYHHFAGAVKPGKSPIDYIFVSEEFEVLSSHISDYSLDGEYPSDHFPLIADVRLKEERL